MMKYLLMGASALALTATAAHAQTTPGGYNPTAAGVVNTEVADTHGSTMQSDYRDNLNVTANPPTGSFDRTLRRLGTAADAPKTAASTISDVSNALPTGMKSNSAGNVSVVDQDGEDNAAYVTQADGNEGWAVANQGGDYSSATVTQSEVNGSSGNHAYVQQISSANGNARGLIATVEQKARNTTLFTGADNEAVVVQGKTGSTAQSSRANISQDGENNDAYVAQGIAGAQRSNNSAMVVQMRENNRASIQQNDDARAYVKQDGYLNAAFVEQAGAASGEQRALILQGGTVGNFAATSQAGDSQYIEIDQSNADLSDAFVKQTANATNAVSRSYQEGTGHFVEVVQDSANSTSLTHQTGNGQQAFVSQAGLASDFSFVSQSGSRNLAVVKQ